MIKAIEIKNLPEIDENVIYRGNPGEMLRKYNQDGSLYGFMVACPKCGQFGNIPLNNKIDISWKVESGTTDDVSTLTLSPSILKHCCGWHGYLRNGIFENC